MYSFDILSKDFLLEVVLCIIDVEIIKLFKLQQIYQLLKLIQLLA